MRFHHKNRRSLLVSLGLLGLMTTACPQIGSPPDVTGPQPPGDLTVTAQTQTLVVFGGSTVTLDAEASDGTSPYTYRWDVNAAPTELTLPVKIGSAVTTGTLSTTGRYVFRVVATDADGVSATAFVAVEVVQAVVIEAVGLAVAGVPLAMTASLDERAEGAEILWTVTRGLASFDDATSLTPMLTAEAGETLEVQVTATLPAPEGVQNEFVDTAEVIAVASLLPRVLIETNMGSLTLELDAEAAPGHVANLLAYVDEGFYDGLLFHRNSCTEDVEAGTCEPFVLQGGGFELIDGEPVQREPTRDPVESEADNGLTNATINSVSLALSGQPTDPNSGTTQFFINLKDNEFLDASGFTVFGSVVDGFDTLTAIVESERESSPILGGEVSFPVEPVIMQSVRRVVP